MDGLWGPEGEEDRFRALLGLERPLTLVIPAARIPRVTGLVGAVLSVVLTVSGLERFDRRVRRARRAGRF
jgi:hypothetical protein